MEIIHLQKIHFNRSLIILVPIRDYFFFKNISEKVIVPGVGFPRQTDAARNKEQTIRFQGLSFRMESGRDKAPDVLQQQSDTPAEQDRQGLHERIF